MVMLVLCGGDVTSAMATRYGVQWVLMECEGLVIVTSVKCQVKAHHATVSNNTTLIKVQGQENVVVCRVFMETAHVYNCESLPKNRVLILVPSGIVKYIVWKKATPAHRTPISATSGTQARRGLI